MKTFKDIVAQDIHAVFLNRDELAEPRTVRYAGEVYADISVSLQELGTEERTRLRASGFGRGGSDGGPGLFNVTAVLFCAKADLGGKVPRQGDSFEIGRAGMDRYQILFYRKYSVIASSCEMGMVRLELGRTGE